MYQRRHRVMPQKVEAPIPRPWTTKRTFPTLRQTQLALTQSLVYVSSIVHGAQAKAWYNWYEHMTSFHFFDNLQFSKAGSSTQH